MLQPYTIITLHLLFTFVAFAAGNHDLFEAVDSDQSDKIEKALQSGSDINEIGPFGQTPLMYAVLRGKTISVQYLLANGADTSIPEKDGYTPMHGAGFQGQWEVAKLLIEHGLEPRDRHKDGYEAIHRVSWGAEEKHMHTAKVLIEAGVPFDVKADDGRTPLEMAQEHTPVFNYLKYLQYLDDSQHHEL
eukprot:CAMPEP_0202710404 /NCGR_PEP_ID=MMETSP1385-20130828/22388_1 /ASSEMBLY_ACC=CAM_ASM_000861 /TAXON_ID=933848 /ORGANISM="Elphidium margaritaceum" /LENGTH=188 /DNA_ID=CAMNT_0049369931 /DNA_START=225 /DNA_END=791 /DNA_ORIENTATION=+